MSANNYPESDFRNFVKDALSLYIFMVEDEDDFISFNFMLANPDNLSGEPIYAQCVYYFIENKWYCDYFENEDELNKRIEPEMIYPNVTFDNDTFWDYILNDIFKCGDIPNINVGHLMSTLFTYSHRLQDIAHSTIYPDFYISSYFIDYIHGMLSKFAELLPEHKGGYCDNKTYRTIADLLNIPCKHSN